MKCPACGAPRALDDKVCKKCRLHFESGQVLDLRPPRASDPRPVPVGPSLAERARASLSFDVRILAGLPVAGLGQVLTGARRLGYAFMIATYALFLLSLPLYWLTVGRIVFGLAVAVHSYAFFELTRFGRSPHAFVRVLGVLVVQGVLLLVYWPAAQGLARLIPETSLVREFRPAYGERWRPYREMPAMDGVVVAFVLAAIVFGIWLYAKTRAEGEDAEQEAS